MKEWDVVVIGGGVAGLTAGIYLKRSSLNAAVFERAMPGGILNNIHRIDNYPGAPKIAGPDLAMLLLNQVTDLGVQIEGEDITRVEKVENGFLLHGYEEHFAKAVIVATGMSASNKKVKGEEVLFGRGVSYCATCDGAFYKGKTVAVIGSNDRAGEDALYLSPIAKEVHMVVPPNPAFSELILEQLKTAENVVLHFDSELLLIQGENRVESIVIQSDGKELTLPVDGVFPMLEGVSASAFLSELNPILDKQFLVVDEDMMTSVPGVFACGDVVKKKLRQIVNAAGEASVAASMAIRYVRSH